MKLNKVQTRDKNFARIYNEILQDKNLSWKARGIFCYLWSLPDDWNYKERNIARQATDGISSLTAGVKELRANGYLIIKRDNNGHTTWYLSDHKLKPHHENPYKENPDMEKPDKENHDELQTTNPYKQLNKQTTKRTDTTTLRAKVIRDLEHLMVHINVFVAQDVDYWIKTYPSKLILKAIRQVGETNPSPRWVPTDISNQLERGCKTNHYKPKNKSKHQKPVYRDKGNVYRTAEYLAYKRTDDPFVQPNKDDITKARREIERNNNHE